LTDRRRDGSQSWGIAKRAGVVDMGRRAPGLKHAFWAMTSLAEQAARPVDFALADITFLPPIPDTDKILCVGLNYLSHIKERRAGAAGQADHLHTLPELSGRARSGAGAPECLRNLRLRGGVGGHHRAVLPAREEGGLAERGRRVCLLQ
jgi:hypothetical protein